MLLIHPGENFDEGARYIVALRGLRNAAGKRIKPSKGFRALKRGAGPQRLRGRYRGIFRTLRRAGVAKGNLTLAWDFTVASERGLTGRMLHIRNDAFRQLGDTNLADRQIQGTAPPTRSPTSSTTPTRGSCATSPARSPCRATSTSRAARPVRASTTRAARRTRCPPSVPATRRPRSSSARSRSPRSSARACRALRPRPARRPRGGRGDEHPRHVAGARLRVLRDGVERHVRRGRPERDQAARRPLGLRLARRPQPAGLPQPDVPRAAADPPAGPDRPPRVPGARRPVAPVLRRQQPGRHPRHGADGDGARLRARGARRARDQLLGAADPLLALGRPTARSSTRPTRASPSARSSSR